MTGQFSMNDIVDATKQLMHNDVPKEYTQADAQEAIRQAIIAINDGSTTLSPKNFYRGSETFALVETLINVIENEGLKGDEFFMDFVDYRNIAEGDKNLFYSENTDTFIVSEIGRGNEGIRRQRLNAYQTYSVTTSPKAIRVYEHLSRLLAGRIDFSTLVQKVTESLTKKRYEDIYSLFTTVASTTPGMYSQACYTGTYKEDDIIRVIDHVEADNDAPATIIGTRNALRKLKMDVVADAAKSDMYDMGYYGKFNGTPTYRIRSRYKTGTKDFIFPDDKLYVIAGRDKFIKFVTEGNAILAQRQAIENADLTQEYWYITQYGLTLALQHCIGLIELTTTP